MQSFTLEAQKEDSGLRLDKFLTVKLPQLNSRTYVKKILSENNVLVNNKPTKAHYKIKQNDKVVVKIPEREESVVKPENIPLEIIYEDDDILIINKSAGMVTHPAIGNYSGTLVNALIYYSKNLSTINTPLRPGIVHRLDKDTSGLLLVAKNNKAHIALSNQFQRHTINRKYIAVVEGVVQFDQGVIDLPIRRHPRLREKMSVGFQKSRKATTIYKTIKRFKNFSLMELSPQTGRTHQLRVHLAYIGHPILGDKKYGKGHLLNRLALHAKVISFQHPRTGKYMEFSSELPKEIKKILED